MLSLDIEDIIYLHDVLVKKTGGTCGIRDIGLLESALSRRG
jgi:prophage maintenance system killer protein